MYPFTFVVTYLSYDGDETSTCGILFADSYAEAAKKIEKEFGDELMSIDHLYALEPKDLIEFTDINDVTAQDIMKSVEKYN